MSHPWIARARVAGALACVASISLSMPAGADATVLEVGSWTRNPIAADPPEGGVAVANAPDGVLTVSAIRFDLGADEGDTATLRLQQADGVAPAGASIRACVTTSTWEPATNGDFSAAPVADCDAGSAALESDEAGLWSGDVTVLLAVTSSVMVLPAADAPAAFSLTFDPPVIETAAAASTTGEAEPAPSSSGDNQSSSSSADPFSGVEAPSSFSALPSELALPPVDTPIPSAAAEEVAVPAALSNDADTSASPLSPGGSGAGRDLGQAFRLGLLSIAVGVASVPVLRLKDGQHVPGLSRLMAAWTERSSTSGPGNPA